MISRWVVKTAVSALAAMGLASLAAWFTLPADTRVPLHFDAAGEVDRYGSLAEGLVMMPLIAAAVFLLIFWLGKQEPRKANLQRSRQLLDWTVTGSMVLLAAIHLAILGLAAGWDFSVTRLISFGLGLLFVLIGNFLPKTRSNFLVGVRTPWTLSSDYSWLRTHIWGGRGFVLLGVVIIAVAAWAPAMSAYAILAGTLSLAFGLIVASWFFWRNDPEMRS
ncbi:MAG: SdpI family protein [Pseudomonadota bacterium]